MEPILEDKAGFRKGKVGFPTTTVATLYSNRIEVADGNGELVAKVPLTKIDRVNFSSSILSIQLTNGQRFSLDFQSIARRAAFSAFGAVGALIGAYTGNGRKIAQEWAYNLPGLINQSKLSASR
jgi:hypothetical protein